MGSFGRSKTAHSDNARRSDKIHIISVGIRWDTKKYRLYEKEKGKAKMRQKTRERRKEKKKKSVCVVISCLVDLAWQGAERLATRVRKQHPRLGLVIGNSSPVEK